MPISTEHKKLTDAKKDIRRLRDTIFGGERQIKKGSTEYLPRLTTMTSERYNEFLSHATFQSITQDTLKEYSGKTFRSDPTWETPFPNELIENIDGMGTHLIQFTEALFEGVASIGKMGIAIVKNNDDPEDLPRFKLYENDMCINWSEENELDDWVVLKERAPMKNPKDRYKHVMTDQYILMEIKDGNYIREIHAKKSNRMSDRDTTRIGAPEVIDGIKRLPFIPINIKGVDQDPSIFPLLPIANLNLRHYRLSSALDWGLIQSQDPITYAGGYEEGEGEVELGKDDLITSPNPDFKMDIVEQRGYNIESLRQTVSDVERQLRYSGAAAMEDAKRQVEAAEAVRLRQAAQSNKIVYIIKGCELGMREALYRMAQFFPGEGLDVDKDDFQFSISRDLIEIRLPAEDVKALIELAREGKITDEVLVYTLFEGEVIPRNTDLGRMIEEIKNIKIKKELEMQQQQNSNINNHTQPIMSDAA